MGVSEGVRRVSSGGRPPARPYRSNNSISIHIPSPNLDANPVVTESPFSQYLHVSDSPTRPTYILPENNRRKRKSSDTTEMESKLTISSKEFESSPSEGLTTCPPLADGGLLNSNSQLRRTQSQPKLHELVGDTTLYTQNFGTLRRKSSFISVISAPALKVTKSTRNIVGFVFRPVKNKLSVELFIHLCLAVAILVYVHVISGHHLAYMRQIRFFLTDILYPIECRHVYLFEDLRTCIGHTVKRVDRMRTNSLSPVYLAGMWPENPDAIARLNLQVLLDGGQVFNSSASTFSLASKWTKYYITEDNLPFGDSPLNQSNTTSFAIQSIHMHFRYKDVNFYNNQRVCLIWDAIFKYNVLDTSGMLMPQLELHQDSCNRPNAMGTSTIANYLVLILALCSLCLDIHLVWVTLKVWRSICQIWTTGSDVFDYQELPRNLEGSFSQEAGSFTPARESFSPELAETSHFRPHKLAKKMTLHSDLTPAKGWWILCGVGNLVQLWNAVRVIRCGRPDGANAEMTLIGLGGLLAWVNLIRYFEFSPRFYILMSTLQRAIKDIIRFMFSCIPVLTGFVVMGMAIFGSSVKEYATFQSTVETLFALMNGDSVLQLLRSGDSVPYVGIVYVSSFMFLFVCAVMNIFTTIVMHSYEIVTGQRRKLSKAEKMMIHG